MRRRIIKVETGDTSSVSEKYIKYIIQIQEKNGQINKVPAYGKDLEDAIKTVKTREKLIKQKKFITKIPINALVLLALSIVSLTAVMFKYLDNPYILFVPYVLLVSGFIWILKRMNYE